ncbi:MAG: nucleotidyltransferase substrate binding protein [Helicobacter sp.]|nr:nucleotidyltransferase substrate binding protein [Helicobacter sp.]
MTNTRFKQRFTFFQRAFLNLNEVKKQENRAFSNLEKEGIIQRFKVLIELCWKILKDCLENEGFMVKSPKESVRKAFEYGLLKDYEKWLEALDMRNITSHTYTQSALDENVRYILGTFCPIVQDLYHTLEVHL